MTINSNASGIANTAANNDFPELIICLSHLRWDFVYQRPQHLLTRMAQRAKVYFVEEPVFDSNTPHYVYTEKGKNLTVVVPHIPPGTLPDQSILLQEQLLDQLVAGINLQKTAFWYYTPMALRFSRKHQPAITVFDCMDELSAFKFAPQELKDLETELMNKAHVVFTGGASLFAAKELKHENIHLFPSSIDSAHFGKARNIIASPEDQQLLPHPRLGFFGVIDERFDIELIDEVAKRRPDWQIILVGPVVKIDPETLPKHANIYYAGSKSYDELPAYLAGWDIALIPFALNESTKFISPTKTPEYLAAGIPVISTPIRDVVNPYGKNGLVHIAATAEELISAAVQILSDNTDKKKWLIAVDAFLEGNSWDNTCAAMQREMTQVFTAQTRNAMPAEAAGI